MHTHPKHILVVLKVRTELVNENTPDVIDLSQHRSAQSIQKQKGSFANQGSEQRKIDVIFDQQRFQPVLHEAQFRDPWRRLEYRAVHAKHEPWCRGAVDLTRSHTHITHPPCDARCYDDALTLHVSRLTPPDPAGLFSEGGEVTKLHI